MYADTGFEVTFRRFCEKFLWRVGHEGLGVERVVRMADVDLSIVYQKVRVDTIGLTRFPWL